MSPREVAHAEAVGEAAITGLLAEGEFRALVAACEALEALPPEARTARLVKLARLAIENALGDGDVRAAVFVLRETGKGRDPAVTLARGFLARRSTAPAVAPAAPAAPPPISPPRARDPVAGMAQRGAAALRAAVMTEHTTRHAAAAAVAREDEAAATAAAARRALALKRAAPGPVPAAAIARLTRRLAGSAAGAALRPAADPPGPLARSLPRRPRAP
jgi:hypothetical protein